jgi:23S rRNA (uracil1939-C5)-methyltransferase
VESCRHFPRCGGCQTLDIAYPEQLLRKGEEVRRHFADWPGLPVQAVIPSPRTRGYRHKVQLPFGLERPAPGQRRAVALGCFEAGSHRVVDQAECLVQEPGLSRAAWAVRDWAVADAVPIYREESGEGWLRYLLLRRGAATGEVILGLVTNGSGGLPSAHLEDLVSRCRRALAAGPEGGELVGVVQNANTRRDNVVLGREERVLWGRGHLRERLGPFLFSVGVSTFFQVNPHQSPRLYDLAVEALPAGKPALDLYCGIGSISLWASRRASEVVGVEENPASVESARAAARENAVANVSFLSGDVSAVLADLAGEAPRPGGRRFAGDRRFAGAIVDPPRKGLEPAVRESLARLGLERLVYVSCYPATLARDARALAGAFRLREIIPVDMFPHTRHVECVAVFDAV